MSQRCKGAIPTWGQILTVTITENGHGSGSASDEAER
jgi:hypothetical protein